MQGTATHCAVPIPSARKPESPPACCGPEVIQARQRLQPRPRAWNPGQSPWRSCRPFLKRQILPLCGRKNCSPAPPKTSATIPSNRTPLFPAMWKSALRAQYTPRACCPLLEEGRSISLTGNSASCLGRSLQPARSTASIWTGYCVSVKNPAGFQNWRLIWRTPGY